jgi:hypothetical protein
MSIASFWTPETQPCGHVHLGGAYRAFGNTNADRWESGREKNVQSATNPERALPSASSASSASPTEPRGINSLGELRLRTIEGRCGRSEPGSQRDRPRQLAEIR